MSHTEKQRIFDQYAKSKIFTSWEHLVNSSNNYELVQHTFAACDLVQQEQQKRIAESVKHLDTIKSIIDEHSENLHSMDDDRSLREIEIREAQSFLKSIKSLNNPEIKIN